MRSFEVNVGSEVRLTSAGGLYRVSAELTTLLFWLARNASRLVPVACATMLISALEAATAPGNRFWQSFAVRASSPSPWESADTVEQPAGIPSRRASAASVIRPRMIAVHARVPGHNRLHQRVPRSQQFVNAAYPICYIAVPGVEQRVRVNLRTVRQAPTMRLLSAR